MRRRVLGGMAAATLLLASGCGGDAQTSDDGSGPILIGAAISETGKYSVEGGGLKQGYDLWVNWVNERGGIDVGGTKRPVEMIYYDDQGNPEAATQLTERLINEDNVDFLFGPYSSGLTMATSAIAERNAVINMSGGGASEEIFERGFQYVFGVATPTKDYMDAILEQLNQAGAQTVGIAHIDNAPMTSVAGGAQTKATELGMEVVAFETLPPTADFTAAVQRIARADPDVFIGAGAFQAAINFTRTAQQINFRPDYMALVNGPTDPEFVNELGQSAERIMGPTQYHPSAPFEGEYFGTAKEYAQLFEETYGQEPPYVAAMGTATALTLQLAIEKAGTIETEAVRQALLELDVETFMGPVNFTETGLNESKPMPGVQIQNGDTVVVAPLPEDATWQLLKYANDGQQ
jgi:branched-chain amino acid transport system substrate-binding protein